ncbi:MAG: fumarylacetoacetate hydrolase family protein [Burkholderiales bacterium]
MPDNRIGDLQSGYAHHLATEQHAVPDRGNALRQLPEEIAELLRIGDPAWKAVRASIAYLTELPDSDPDARGPNGERLILPLDECRLHAPIHPGKIVAIGRNYPEHVKEDPGSRTPTYIPSCWIKANSSITGPYDDVVKPACVREFDYENELCVVIGKTCKNINEADAYDYIAGYTIMNDLSARDIIRLERREGNLLIGKMFEGFAPMGPWFVSKDEIPDAMNLQIRTRVNGQLRQDGNTRDMIWPIPKLVAYLSQMRLDPGDIISTGTPAGTGLGRRKNESPWWLNQGDVLESEIEGIGTMRNRIVGDPGPASPWAWPDQR